MKKISKLIFSAVIALVAFGNQAKAAPWANTDAHARKRGEQTGLDTLVVHALNDVNWSLEFLSELVLQRQFQSVC